MKKLYVPGRVWLDVNSFVAEFPQTKLPLVMLLGDSLLKEGVSLRDGFGKTHAYGICFYPYEAGGPGTQIGTNAILLGGNLGKNEEGRSLCSIYFGGFPLGIDQWTYDKKIETYRDIVKGALSPEFPLTIKFQANLDLRTGSQFSFGKTCSPSRWWYVDAKWFFGDFSVGNIAWIMWHYMKEIPDGALFPRGFPDNENCCRVYKDQMINEFASRGFSYFEAKSYPEWKQYNEIYA